MAAQSHTHGGGPSHAAFSVADVVTSMLEGTGASVAAPGSPLAVLQARHRASVMAMRDAAAAAAAAGDDLDSHARQARRQGSVVSAPGSPRLQYLSLEKRQRAQLAAWEAWRTALHKEAGSRSALDIMQLSEWIREGLARPGQPAGATTAAAGTTTAAANGASPSPVAGVSTAAPAASSGASAASLPISPFLQQLPPLVRRGLCSDLGLLFLDRGEVRRLGRSTGACGEGYFIVLSGQVGVTEIDPDAPPPPPTQPTSPMHRHGRAISRAHTVTTSGTRSPSPRSLSPTHPRSVHSSLAGSPAPTPMHSRPHTAANALPATLGSRPSSGSHLSPHVSPRAGGSSAAQTQHFTYSFAATAPLSTTAVQLAAADSKPRSAQPSSSAPPAAEEKEAHHGVQRSNPASPSLLWRKVSSAMRPPSSGLEGLDAGSTSTSGSGGGTTASTGSGGASDDDDEGLLDERELHRGLHLLGGVESVPLHSRMHVEAGGKRWRLVQPGFGFGHAALLHAFNDANHAQQSGLADDVKGAESIAEQLRDTAASSSPPRDAARGPSSSGPFSDRSAPTYASATHRRPQHSHHSIDAGRPVSAAVDGRDHSMDGAFSSGTAAAGSSAGATNSASPSAISSPPVSSLLLRSSACEVAATGGLHGFIPVSHVKALSGPAELLFIPRSSFLQAVHRTSLGKLNRRIEVLRRIFLFNRWSFEKLSRFCMGLRRVRLAQGAHLYRQGDPANTVYFLEKGDVLTEYNVSVGRSLVEKQPPSHEMSTPHSATTTATAASAAATTSSKTTGAESQRGAGSKSNSGVNVGAGPGGFSISGENYAHLSAEAALFHARTRRRRGPSSSSTLHHSTSASVSSSTRRQRREAEEDAADDGDGTDSRSEEEDNLVEHAMRALNTGVGLGVGVGVGVGIGAQTPSQGGSRSTAPEQQLGELSEELAPQHKLMLALQSQIAGRRSEFGRGRGDVARRARLILALQRERSTIRYSKYRFKARPMPASFSIKRMSDAEEEAQQMALLAHAALERKKAEARSAAEAAWAPPPSAAEAAKAAAAAAAAAAAVTSTMPAPPVASSTAVARVSSLPSSSTETGVTDLLASSRQRETLARKQGVMFKLRHMQLVKNAARLERLREMAEEETRATEVKQAQLRADKERAEAFRKMVHANAATVKRNATSAAAALAAAAKAASSSAAHTHHSYVALFPFCTYLGSLTPPGKRGGGGGSGGARRPAVQFFKLFLLHPRALRLHICFEETLDMFGVGSSTGLAPAAAAATVSSSNPGSGSGSGCASSSGLSVSYGDSAVPTPGSCTWRAQADAAENAVANHASSRMYGRGNSSRRRAARGLVQNYCLHIDPATDPAFRQPGPAAAALREGCYYYIAVQCMYECTFVLKLDFMDSSSGGAGGGGINSNPSVSGNAAAHQGSSGATAPSVETQLSPSAPSAPTKAARASSLDSVAIAAALASRSAAAAPPSQPAPPSSASLRRPHHVVALSLLSGARPTMVGELELLSTSALDASGVRLTSARALTPCTLFAMDRATFFEHLKGELWSRLQSLIRKQKKIYMRLVAASSAVRYRATASVSASATAPPARASLHQRSMFVRARLPDAQNLEAHSALPSAPRAKNYRAIHSAMLGAAAPAPRGVGGPNKGAVALQAPVPSINYMFPALADYSSSASSSSSASPSDSDGVDQADSEAQSASPSPRRASSAPSSSSTTAGTLVLGARASRRPHQSVQYNDAKTFFELFGLDELNESITPILAAQQQHVFAHEWQSRAFEVPNPAPIGSSNGSGGGSSGARSASPSVVQLSTAQESKFHFRTHALSSVAAERKRIRREKLLAQQRRPSPPPPPQVAPGVSVSRPLLLLPSPAGPDGATTSPERSGGRAPSLADLSWEQYQEFLSRDRAVLDTEIAGLDVQALQAKLRAEEMTQAELEGAMAEEQSSASEEDEESGAAVVVVEEENDEDEEDEDANEGSMTGDDYPSPTASPRASPDERDLPAIGSHGGKRQARLPGSSPQHYFYSHGHHLLYAGYGTPAVRRLPRDGNRSAHLTLAERMQSRTSKSLIGVRFDHVWHIERESERKWLASNSRTAQIQKAIADMAEQMDSSQMASAALSSILASAAKELEGTVLARSDSTDTVLSDQLPTGTAVPGAAVAVAARSDSAPDLYPPSSSVHYGISAKGSQILEAQLPHLASMVVAAEERMDPYGDSFLPSAVEQSVAAAAAAQAGLAVAPQPRRRIVGAPAFMPRPPPLRHSVLADPEATEKAVNPEPNLSVFRVSKRAVSATAAKNPAKNGGHSARASEDFGARPSTAAAGVTADSSDAGRAAARPGTAPSFDTARPATAGTGSTSAATPFSDTSHFPPQRYPPSAPTLAAALARDPHHNEREQARPWQPHAPMSFKDRTAPTKPPVLRSSLSLWPDASMSNQPLAYNIRTASAAGQELPTPEHELLHIRGGWAPHRDLLATHLSHCVPCPPASALVVPHFTVPAPAVRAGSVTARARTHSARAAKQRALSGSNTARPMTAHTSEQTGRLHVVLRVPSSSGVPPPDQGATPLDSSHASASDEHSAGPDGLHAASSHATATGTTPPRSPSAVRSRIGSPSRAPSLALGSRSPGAMSSPARLPRQLGGGSGAIEADTLALTPSIDRHDALMLQTGADAADERRATEEITVPDPLSAWSVLPAPPTPTASRPSTAQRSKPSKFQRTKSGSRGTSSRGSNSPSNGRRKSHPHGSSSSRTKDAGAPSVQPGGDGAAAAPQTTSSPIDGIVNSTAKMAFSAYFQVVSSDDAEDAPASASASAPAPPRPATTEPTASENNALQLPNAQPAPPTHQRRPSTSPAGGLHPARSRRPSRFYQCDANGVPRSGDASPRLSMWEMGSPGEEEGEESGSGSARRLRLAPSAEALQQSSLFKTQLNFRDMHSRNRSVSVNEPRPIREHADEDAPLSLPLPASSLQSSSGGRRRSSLSPPLGAFEEAALRSHEPSTRWQLIDELYEKQRVDEHVHTIERISLTRVTSEMKLLDHRGQQLPDRAATAPHQPHVDDDAQRPNAAGTAASDESDADADLSALSAEEKAARWAARLAKQERRVAVEQAEADRRLREALDDADLEDDDEQGEDDGAGASGTDGVPVSSARARRRRLRMQRFGSLSAAEQGVAERMDLEAEAELLQQRIEEAAEAASPYAAGNGLIHQELKMMRKSLLEAKQREIAAEILASPPQQQRRAAAFQALDEHGQPQLSSATPATDAPEATETDHSSSLHARQASIMNLAFEEGHASTAGAAGAQGRRSSVTGDGSMHPVTATGAPPSLQVQQRDLFRHKASEFARDHPVSPATALRLLDADGTKHKGAGSTRGKRSGAEGSGVGGASRAARNQLAQAMRTPALSRARKQLAASSQLQHIVSMEAGGQSSATHLSQLAAELGGRGGEEKSSDGPPLHISQLVPRLHLTGVVSRAGAGPNSSSSARDRDRSYHTLHNATGFATWRPTSPLALHPAPLPATVTPWQVARFQRHAQREAQESARQAANAARLIAAEQVRTQLQSAELTAHARALAQAKHAPPSTSVAVSGHPPHHLPAASLSSHLGPPTGLIDKSVHHPLQRLRLKYQHAQRQEQRSQHILQLQQAANAASAQDA